MAGEGELLRLRDDLPDGFFEAGHRELNKLFGGPTLISLDGGEGAPLFVSVLQHGDEPAGFEAIKIVLGEYRDGDGGFSLPRPVRLFVANVVAAEQNVRRLPDQPDFNRIWPGVYPDPTPESELLEEVTWRMRDERIFASVDIHNNSGENPYYACVTRLEPDFLALASHFGHRVVHFGVPKGVQSMAFSQFAPAVTLECGRPGDQGGIDQAVHLLRYCLETDLLIRNGEMENPLEVHHTLYRIEVAPEVSLSFNGCEADICFSEEIVHHNFEIVAAGTPLARCRPGLDRLPIFALDDRGVDLADDIFSMEQGEIRLKHEFVPSMLTANETMVRQDCLGYLMQRLDID